MRLRGRPTTLPNITIRLRRLSRRRRCKPSPSSSRHTRRSIGLRLRLNQVRITVITVKHQPNVYYGTVILVTHEPSMHLLLLHQLNTFVLLSFYPNQVSITFVKNVHQLIHVTLLKFHVNWYVLCLLLPSGYYM